MSIQSLEVIEKTTGENPQYCVIWLHGLGADGHDFEPIVSELTLPADKPTRFIFPHAPFQPITVNKGAIMRAWYDIQDQQIDHMQDIEGINDSTSALMGLIEQQIETGIAAENIVIAGFSQGGVIALNTAMRYHSKLAGVMALSTYLPMHDVYPEMCHEANKDTSIFMAHGEHDDVISYLTAEKSHQKLVGMGYNVDWHSYPIAHGVGPQEIDDISAWLQRVFN